MLRATLVLDDLFDPAKGWTFPPHQVPLERTAAPDGNPVYVLVVDGIAVQVFEQTEWAHDAQSTHSAMRIGLIVESGIKTRNAMPLALGTMATVGRPAWAVDDEGDMAIVYALPFSDEFPVDLLRKQMLVAVGIAVQEMRESLAVLNNTGRAASEARWDQARQVASVAGTFARALFL